MVNFDLIVDDTTQRLIVIIIIISGKNMGMIEYRI